MEIEMKENSSRDKKVGQLTNKFPIIRNSTARTSASSRLGFYVLGTQIKTKTHTPTVGFALSRCCLHRLYSLNCTALHYGRDWTPNYLL